LLPRAHFTITATTRRPRKDERHGVDYYFVSPDQFKQMVESGEMLEHALVMVTKGAKRADTGSLAGKMSS
jgi:guanylate kinase